MYHCTIDTSLAHEMIRDAMDDISKYLKSPNGLIRDELARAASALKWVFAEESPYRPLSFNECCEAADSITSRVRELRLSPLVQAVGFGDT